MSSSASETPISLWLAAASTGSGLVAEAPYTRITNNWPIFSSRLIRRISVSIRRRSRALREALRAVTEGTPAPSTAEVAAAAVRTARRDGRWCMTNSFRMEESAHIRKKPPDVHGRPGAFRRQ